MHGEAEVSGGGRLYFESEGEGHPVVLVHAGIVDRRMWDREFTDWSKRFRVIRYDVRGFGRSPPARVPYSDAADLGNLLRHLDIDRPMLVGASMGGRIALDYAVEHAGEVEALVPVCAGVAGYEPTPETRPAFDALDVTMSRIADLHKAGRVEDALDLLVATWAGALPGAAVQRVRTLVRENAAAAFGDEELSVPLVPSTASRLRELRVPTLVVTGERDQPAMDAFGDFIFEQIPGAERLEIPGTDHFPNLGAPALFDEKVLEFLE